MTVQSAAESTVPVELDVWGDLVCPWSWIAKRRLEAAIHAFERPHDVTLALHAFELAPDRPVGENAPVAHGAAAGGPDPERHAQPPLGEVPEADDLIFDWDRAVTANTFDALRLTALAREMGGPALQWAAVERFFSAHFREGLALDDREVLQRLGAECGLDERRVSAVLAADSYAERVRADEQRGRELGITVTPFVVANGSRSLGGLRTVEEYLDLMRAVAVQPV